MESEYTSSFLYKCIELIAIGHVYIDGLRLLRDQIRSSQSTSTYLEAPSKLLEPEITIHDFTTEQCTGRWWLWTA